MLLIPVVVGHRLGMVSATRGRQIAVRVGLQGANAALVRERGAEYAKTVLPGTVRRSVLDRIDWHKANGDEVVIVSASLDVYLAPWCKDHRVDCICTTLEERRGRLTGRYVQGDCSGAEKARRIRQRYELARYECVYAYGDSGEDREMLDLAHKKFYRGREIESWDEVRAL